MGINSEITNGGYINYPMLKIHSELGYIVLFTGPKKGFVVNVNEYWPIGTTDKTWFEEDFSIYTGKLTLENK